MDGWMDGWMDGCTDALTEWIILMTKWIIKRLLNSTRFTLGLGVVY